MLSVVRLSRNPYHPVAPFCFPGRFARLCSEQNFSGKAKYQDLLTDENTQRDRPGDVRPMEVPKKDSYGRNVSEFVGNAYGADVTPDSMASEIEMLVQEGALGFDKKQMPGHTHCKMPMSGGISPKSRCRS